MKKLVLILVAIVSGTVMIHASNPKKESLKEKLRNEIVQLLDTPYIELQDEETLVNVEFIVNSKGEIVVLAINSDNREIDGYIKSELNYKKLKSGIVAKGKVFKMPLRIMKAKV